jgi:hypothetical protein
MGTCIVVFCHVPGRYYLYEIILELSVFTHNLLSIEFEPRYVQEFSLLKVVKTGSGTHPASYTIGSWGAISVGIKRPESEAEHSLPTNVDVRKRRIHAFTPLYAFVAWCLIS